MDAQRPLILETEDSICLMRHLEEDWNPIFDNTEICIEELKKIHKRIYKEDSRFSLITPEKLDTCLKNADLNKNEKIDYNEFKHLMIKQSNSVLPKEKSLIIRLVYIAFNNMNKKREEYEANRACCPPPLFVIFIILANICVFLYYCLTMKQFENLISLNSSLIYNPDKKSQLWRFFTYSFLHGGILHLLSNIILLIIFGITLETVHKAHRVAPIFFCGVIAASLSVSVFDPKSYLLGSSGGVFALFAAHLSNIILNYEPMKKGFGFSGRIRILVVLLFVVLNVSVTMYNIWQHKVTQQSIFSHLFGAIAGFFVGFTFLKDTRPNEWKPLLWCLGSSLYVLLLLFFILYDLIKSYLSD